jgi:hypothetical protein
MTAPANLPYGTALTGSNAIAWAEQILADLGAPQTSANINSLVDWFALEGGGGQNNPLNTTVVAAGATGPINSVGVQGYATPDEGAAAIAQTLEQSNFSGILALLKGGGGLIGNTSIAGELSSWSGGGYSKITGTSASTATGTATATGSSASTGTGGTGTPAASYSVLGVGDVVSAVTGPARDLATALDYVFGMFGRGQGWRLVFTLVAAGALLLSYRALSSAGAVPDMHLPEVKIL